MRPIVALYCDYGCDTDVAENKMQLSTINNNILKNKRQEEAGEIGNSPPGLTVLYGNKIMVNLLFPANHVVLLIANR